MIDKLIELIPELLPKSKNALYTQKKIDLITNVINFIGNFDLEEDTITATDYKNLKQTLNGLNYSGFYNYLDNNTNFPSYSDALKKYPILNKLFWDKPDDLYRITPNKIKSYKTELRKASGFQKDAIQHIVNRLEMFLPLAEKVKEMKNCIAKKETKKDVKKHKIETIKGKLDKKLKNILEEIAESFRIKIENNRIRYYENKLKNYDNTKVKRYRDITDIQYFIDPSSRNYELKRNAIELIPDKAKKDSEEIIQDFIFKMYDKLGGLIVNFPDVDVEYDGSVYRNRITFKLNSDTYFTVENNITYGVSKYGVWFNRYPTTFHNVVINGEKMNTPSEVKVKKELNKLKK